MLFSHSIVSNSLWPHGLQHARLPCPSPTAGAYSNSCPLSWWCHPTISSSVVLFSSHLQSFPTLNDLSQMSKWQLRDWSLEAKPFLPPPSLMCDSLQVWLRALLSPALCARPPVEFLEPRQWHPTPVLLPGKSHGRRSLVGCSPWGTTERLPFHFSLSCIGEGNGNQFLPGESQGWGNLVGFRLWGRTESDTTEAT